MSAAKRPRVDHGRDIPDATREGFERWLGEQSNASQDDKHFWPRRVALMKGIEKGSADMWEAKMLAEHSDLALQKHMRAVVLESNLAGLEEFGRHWSSRTFPCPAHLSTQH